MGFVFSVLYYDALKNDRDLSSESMKEILLALNIVSDSIFCSFCNTFLSIHLDSSKGMLVRYWCSSCKKRIDVRKFTVFKEFKTDIRIILRFIILFSVGKSLTEIRNSVSISKNTGVKLAKLIREAIRRKLDNSPEILGTDGIVEIDETLIAKKRKNNCGRVVDQTWLFGAVERGTGKILLSTVESRDAATLGKCIKQFINENAVVYSDQWAAYLSYFGDVGTQSHETVNHSKNFLNPKNPQIHTQTIEGLWSILKKWLFVKNLRRRDHLELYLGEFILRRNNRKMSEFHFFELIMSLLVEMEED